MTPNKECVRCGSFQYSTKDTHTGICRLGNGIVESDHYCSKFSWSTFAIKKYKIKVII